MCRSNDGGRGRSGRGGGFELRLMLFWGGFGFCELGSIVRLRVVPVYKLESYYFVI